MQAKVGMAGWTIYCIFPAEVVTRRLGGIPEHVQDLFCLILVLSCLSLCLSCRVRHQNQHNIILRNVLLLVNRIVNIIITVTVIVILILIMVAWWRMGIPWWGSQAPISLIHQFLLPPIKDDIRYITYDIWYLAFI